MTYKNKDRLAMSPSIHMDTDTTMTTTTMFAGRTKQQVVEQR